MFIVLHESPDIRIAHEHHAGAAFHRDDATLRNRLGAGRLRAGEGRFQPVHTDYRNVFAETITRLFHFDPFASQLFPGYKGNGDNFLGFMKQMKEA